MKALKMFTITSYIHIKLLLTSVETKIKYTAEYKSKVLLIQIFINARLVLLLEGIWI